MISVLMDELVGNAFDVTLTVRKKDGTVSALTGLADMTVEVQREGDEAITEPVLAGAAGIFTFRLDPPEPGLWIIHVEAEGAVEVAEEVAIRITESRIAR